MKRDERPAISFDGLLVVIAGPRKLSTTASLDHSPRGAKLSIMQTGRALGNRLNECLRKSERASARTRSLTFASRSSVDAIRECARKPPCW